MAGHGSPTGCGLTTGSAGVWSGLGSDREVGMDRPDRLRDTGRNPRNRRAAGLGACRSARSCSTVRLGLALGEGRTDSPPVEWLTMPCSVGSGKGLRATGRQHSISDRCPQAPEWKTLAKVRPLGGTFASWMSRPPVKYTALRPRSSAPLRISTGFSLTTPG